MTYRWPDDAQWQWLQQQADPSAPLSLFNLLRFHSQADYPAASGETPCSGIEAYKRYSALALPCLAEYGARIAFSGRPGPTMIGPVDEHWDLVLQIEYPSVTAFLDMASSARYRAFSHHRTAAVADSRLYPVIGTPAAT